jgi:hypothetical protein
MRPQDRDSSTAPHHRIPSSGDQAAAPRGKATKVRLTMSQHGSLLTPAVLAVLYDIIESSGAASGQDEKDLQAS